MEPSNWAPEHSGALREYLALGMTYSEIARAINAKFNTHYSRNAALSRMAVIEPGQLTWDRTLFTNLALYGLVPLITLISVSVSLRNAPM